jgi:hypothetical protein
MGWAAATNSNMSGGNFSQGAPTATESVLGINQLNTNVSPAEGFEMTTSGLQSVDSPLDFTAAGPQSFGPREGEGFDWGKLAQAGATALAPSAPVAAPTVAAGSVSGGQPATGLLDYYSRHEPMQAALSPQGSQMGLLSSPRRSVRR